MRDNITGSEEQAELPLSAFADAARWVAYDGAPKDDGTINKAPRTPSTGALASLEKAATWGIRAKAERRAARLVAPGHKPGIGIVLGDNGDGTYLCGVDLDGCIWLDGEMTPWANAIMARLDSYAELSPSGGGVKVYFTVAAADIPGLCEAMGKNDKGEWHHRRQWKISKHVGVELHRDHSYYAVTERPYGPLKPLRRVPLDVLRWIVKDAGPAVLKARTDVPDSPRTGSGTALDNSGSGVAYRLLWSLFRAGATEEEARADIARDMGTAGEWWGRVNARQHDRAVAKAMREVERERERLGAVFDDLAEEEEIHALIWGRREVPKAVAVVEARATALGRYAFDQDGVIRAFTDRHKGELLFDHHAGKWYRFGGVNWQREETKLAHHYAREVSTQLAKRNPKAKPLKSVPTWEAVERGARFVRDFATTSARWDTDPMFLGTPGGTVELRTGEMRSARPGDYISKLTAVAPIPLDSFDPARDCPRWLAFLDFALGGDAAAIRFLQQWGGYCLTGDTREQVLLFVYGEGGSGKGTAINTLAAILKDYAVAVATSTLTAKKYEAHPEEIARLHGPRMAVASETEKGSRWAENRIKSLTGQDVLTARYMRENSFDFRPQFKLTIFGNNAPSLSDVDSAIRRRFLILPFSRKPAQKDELLGEKLKAEWPGILSWLIAGCLDWQANGLVRPAVVNAATESYFAEQDTFGQWIEDRCETGPGRAETVERLYDSWCRYANRIGEEPGSKVRVFPERLQQAGFTPVKDTAGIRGRGFAGIRLAPELDDDGFDMI